MCERVCTMMCVCCFFSFFFLSLFSVAAGHFDAHAARSPLCDSRSHYSRILGLFVCVLYVRSHNVDS